MALNKPAEVEAAREGWKGGGRDQSGRQHSGGTRGRPRLHRSPLSFSRPAPRKTDLPQLRPGFLPLMTAAVLLHCFPFLGSVVSIPSPKDAINEILSSFFTCDPEKGSDPLEDEFGWTGSGGCKAHGS